jgi:hypothetical protein
LCLWSQQLGQEPPVSQQHIIEQHQCHVMLASKLAVATFWDMLYDFVGVGVCPPKWEGTVSSTHPFVCLTPGNDQEPRKLSVRRLLNHG